MYWLWASHYAYIAVVGRPQPVHDHAAPAPVPFRCRPAPAPGPTPHALQARWENFSIRPVRPETISRSCAATTVSGTA